MHLLKFSCCISFFINCSFAFTFITLPIINPNYNRNLHKNTSFNNRYNKNYHHNFNNNNNNNNNNYHYNNIKNNNYNNNNFKNDYINSERNSNDHNGDNQSNEYINRKNILATTTTTTAKTIGLETDNPHQITKNYDNDDNNNYETVSFGIRSFTVEITPPTEKPSINMNPNNGNVNLEKLKGSMGIHTKTINHNNVLFTSTSESSMPITSTKSSSIPLQPPSSSSSSSLSLPSLELSPMIHNSKENQNVEDSNDNIKLNNNEHLLGNGMHIEKQLKNGLYRIKIAEIITDEFDNGLGDINSVDNEHKSIDNLHKQNINNNDNNENIINNNNNRNRNEGKINIADLYPSKLEDFTSIIKDSNEKIIHNKNFVNNDKNNRQNDAQLQQQQHPSHQKVNVLNQQIDNSTNVIEQQQQMQEVNDPLYTLIENNIPTTKIEIELIDEINSNNSVAINGGGGRSEIDDNIQNQTAQINIINNNNKAKSTQINLNFTDFTSQLQQNDGVISTIENDFKNNINDLKEEPSAVTVPTLLIPTTPTPTRTITKTTTASSIQLNKDVGHIYFIDRRVKKNKINYRETPQNDIQRIDSPITRFTNTNHNIEQNLESSQQQQQHQSSLDVNKNEKPEFSTTKFYNSKELYNELLHKNLDEDAAHDFENNTNSTNNNNEPIKFETTTLPSSSITSAPNVSTGLQSSSLSSTSPSPILTTTTTITSTTTLPVISNSKKPFQITIFNINVPKNSTMDKQKQLHQNTISTTMFTANTPLSTSTSSSFDNSNTNNSLPLSSSNKNNIKTNESLILMGNQSELQQQNKDEIEVKEKLKPNKKITMQHLNVLLSNRSNNSNNKNLKQIILEKSAKQQHKLDSVKGTNSSDEGVGDGVKHSKNNEPKKTLTRLQEKINLLECDIQYLSHDSHVWRGNETHELNLPNTIPENCPSGMDCLPMIVSWEGIAEIQSGDVLLVEIDDTLLIPASNHDTFNITTSNDSNLHKSNTAAVYQVTRPGHEHCDVTEGILLDITPLVVDGKKLVTLYDKDLTEGVNLLIVVSELWARQCVRLKVTVKSDNCGENAECSGKGVCFSNTSMEGYECQCCAGYAGSHCEEIDACTPSPCTNNGICVDLSQGHEGNAYQCLCPYGYTGKNCQFESDPCNPSECLNGGSCVGNVTHFRCECAAGFTGPLCQHNLNECESSPCVHGICVDQEDGFRCFCQPGFAGELCNFEYNECESNPCLNGGQCTDQIGGFSCTCTRGYAGKRCHIKLDFCSNNPCPEGHRCNDRGDDFICECPSGRNGPDCNEVPRTLCNVNPCSNGGTCWTSEESFYCACRPGFTGKMCEDEFIVETVVSSSEIISDDPSTNTRTFSAVVSTSKGTIGLHNAYIAAGTFATAIFIVAIVVVISQCKFSKSYRQFTTKHHQLIPILGFNIKRRKSSGHRHWLSGKGNIGAGGGSSGNNITAANNCNNTTSGMKSMTSVQLLHQHNNSNTTAPSNTNINGNAKGGHHTQQHRNQLNRHLAMNLENDMYYTVDFSDSQNSPLIQ